MNNNFNFLAEKLFPSKEYEGFSFVKGRMETASDDCSFPSIVHLDDKNNIKNGQIVFALKNPFKDFYADIGKNLKEVIDCSELNKCLIKIK